MSMMSIEEARENAARVIAAHDAVSLLVGLPLLRAAAVGPDCAVPSGKNSNI